MKYIISTLGCKVNQYETQAMEALLLSHGHTAAAEGERADAVIVNSCAVTAESGRKTRQLIRRLHEENPEAVIAVGGCYSQLEPESVRALGARVVFGAAERTKFIEAVERAVAEGEEISLVDKPFERRVFEEMPAGALGGRTRAMLKIQDGCVNFCSYCIIPYTRGRLRSLPIESACAEAARLAGEGYRELVLTGIEVASYGVDLPGKPGLGDVIAAIGEVSGDMRIRLGSLEPTVVTDEFCEKVAASGKLCRHFHLSLQSGCDETLRRMRRKYDTERYFRSVALLREHFDRPGITTDLIVGFPGETEAEFEATLAFLRRCAFSRMHIFPYSRRQGTPAASMPGQVPNSVKADRAARAAALAGAMEKSWLTGWIGQSVPVLFEEEKAGFWRGYTPQYMEVRVPAAGQALHNLVRTVTVTAAGDTAAFGVIKEEEP